MKLRSKTNVHRQLPNVFNLNVRKAIDGQNFDKLIACDPNIFFCVNRGSIRYVDIV